MPEPTATVDVGGVLVELPEAEPEKAVRVRKPFTPEECVRLAHVWNRETGAPPTMEDWDVTHRRRNIRNMLERISRHRESIDRYLSGGYPSSTTVKKYYCSWNAFIHACGWEPRSPGRPTIHTTHKPDTPTIEQVKRRVGEIDANTGREREFGRNVMARLVRNVLAAEQAHDAEALKLILLEGAAELVAWADHLEALNQPRKAAA